MTPELLRRISAGLALTMALGLGAAACGSGDGGGGSGSGGTAQSGGGSGGTQQSGGSGGLASGGAGSGGLASGGAGSGGMDASTDAPIDYGPYPAGPYGNEVGDTIANLAWEGYVNTAGAAPAHTLPYGDYSTDEMRKSGKPYGLIHISAFT